ncbi:hypothetical protein PIROE2DRAFT_8779 [Piromyces sp. E2]|nr:hypothetical protein PIROE2DRAFT_8779 [Piromyces sp. E2]|eukprot:OUM64467.1 hypothetical protein PIROE2DRAFT_8779 [Piromyces sp. E2]
MPNISNHFIIYDILQIKACFDRELISKSKFNNIEKEVKSFIGALKKLKFFYLNYKLVMQNMIRMNNEKFNLLKIISTLTELQVPNTLEPYDFEGILKKVVVYSSNVPDDTTRNDINESEELKDFKTKNATMTFELNSQFKLRGDNRLGLISVSANYVQLYINNEYMGLYIIIDMFKLFWVERVFGDKDFTFLFKSSDLENIFEVDFYFYEQATEYLTNGWNHINNYHNYYFYKQPNGKWIYLTYNYDLDFGIYTVDIDNYKYIDFGANSEGRYPERINETSGKFYSMEVWDGNSKFTSVYTDRCSYGIKYWILFQYRNYYINKDVEYFKPFYNDYEWENETYKIIEIQTDNPTENITEEINKYLSEYLVEYSTETITENIYAIDISTIGTEDENYINTIENSSEIPTETINENSISSTFIERDTVYDVDYPSTGTEDESYGEEEEEKEKEEEEEKEDTIKSVEYSILSPKITISKKTIITKTITKLFYVKKNMVV